VSRAAAVWAGLVLLAASVAGAAEPTSMPGTATPGGEPAAENRPPYDATGRRDPFRPFVLDIRSEPAVYATPLQRYELGQLTVVATMWSVSPPRAIVQDSAEMGYIVTPGTAIGRNGGVVTAIEPQRVIVEERVLDYYGQEQTNRIVMETPRDQGPAQPGRERERQ
jgi:hypothetical protein